MKANGLTSNEVPWHTLPYEFVLDRLGTSIEGLRPTEAIRHREKFGRNVFPEQEAPSLTKIVLHQFASPLIYILLVAGAISIAIGDAKDAIFIFTVIVLNAGLGAYQEWRAEQSATALKRMLTIITRVRRAGDEQQIAAEDLVPGDIVLLEAGRKVPADVRLLHANNLSTA